MPRRSADRRAETLRRLLLVVVTDRKRCRGDLVESCEAAVRGGATAVLLRDRDLPRAKRRALARKLRSITARYGAALLVHTDAALAREVDADGVHLDSTAGRAEIAAARRVVGPSRFVGVSTHAPSEIDAAERARADYLFLGPVFPGRSHRRNRGLGWKRAAHMASLSRVPWVAIGGVRPDRLEGVRWPLNRVAAIDAILAGDDPARAAGALLAALTHRSDWGPSHVGGGDERTLVGEFLRAMGANPALSLGPGDDAVVIREGGMAVATDLTVEGIHYEAGTPSRAAGFKAAGRALSDLAAVGAEPVGIMVGMAVRRGLQATTRARGIERGAAAAAAAVGASILGGDTKETEGTETIAVTAIGRVTGPPPLPRSGGRPGDVLFVSGPLGGSIHGRHLRPRPRIDIGLALRRRRLATACIDLSDGLEADLHRLCRASATGAMVVAPWIPVHRDAGVGRRALLGSWVGGEDYELLFAVSPERAAAVEAGGVAGHRVHRIGRLVHRSAGLVVQQGSEGVDPLLDTGWVHFRER